MAVISPVTVPLLVRSTSYSINYVRVQANYSIKNARAGLWNACEGRAGS